MPATGGVADADTALAPPVMATTGATVSTVNAWVAVPVFPAASVAETDTETGPWARAAGVVFQVPSAATVADSFCDPTSTVTLEPAGLSVVPDTVGVVVATSAVAPPVMVTTGGVVSTGVTVEADTLAIRWVSTTEPDDAVNPNW